LNNLYFMEDYRKKRKGRNKRRSRNIQEVVYELCMSELVDFLFAVEETEELLSEIERDHGSEILESTWVSLSQEEQKELLHTLNALIRKMFLLRKKTTSFVKKDKPPL